MQQVNTAQLPQYTAVTGQQATVRTLTSGNTVYIAPSDYITYPIREYYPNNGTNTNTTIVSNGLVVAQGDQYHTVRQQLTNQPNVVGINVGGGGGVVATAYATNETDANYIDRYLRQQQQPITTTTLGTLAPVAVSTAAVAAITTLPISNGAIHNNGAAISNGLTVVGLPSPDNGIGDANATPRAENSAIPQVSFCFSGGKGNSPRLLTFVLSCFRRPQQIFEYANLQTPTQALLAGGNSGELTPTTVATGMVTPGLSSPQMSNASSTPGTPASATKSSRRSWHEYGRNSDIDKILIPKL